MTDKDIIFDWISRIENQYKLVHVAYSKEVYDFIVATADKISFGEKEFYRVNNQWQVIVKKNY